MARKELRRMRRSELIEIIYELKHELGKVEKEKADLEEELKHRKIKIENAGSIAEAALCLNDIFSVAQAAADDYLNAIREQTKNSEM